MQTAKCKCGEKQSWGEMPPCNICEKCGTAPGYANAETAQPHRFSKKFDQNTGKPFNFCMVCGRKEEVLFEPKCSGCGHSEHKFLCLHTIELSSGEHDVCDCQSFSPAEPDATARARVFAEDCGYKWVGEMPYDRLPELFKSQLLAFLESETPRIKADAVREFCDAVDNKAQELMIQDGKVEGKHYAAMRLIAPKYLGDKWK